MKKLLFILLLVVSSVLKSQSTVNPDTVCYQTPGSTYQIDPIAGVVFQWTVSAPGILVSGQGTNSIVVNWSNAAPGLINTGISVTAVGQNCPVIPVDLDVFIYQPIVNITAIGPFCTGDPCAQLTASIPNGLFGGVGVVNNQFCPNVSGDGTFQVSYLVDSFGCLATATVNIVVNNSINLGLIEHN
jgi:hypothetical protein